MKTLIKEIYCKGVFCCFLLLPGSKKMSFRRAKISFDGFRGCLRRSVWPTNELENPRKIPRIKRTS